MARIGKWRFSINVNPVVARLHIARIGGLLVLLLATALLLDMFGAGRMWIAVVLVLAAAVAVGALARVALKPMHFVHALALTVGWLIVVTAILPVAIIPRVMKQARTSAANARYCIQVASSDGDYRPAQSLLDLSGLTVHASGLQFHAVLIVEDGDKPRLFNWSYRRGDWVPFITGPMPVIRCRSQLGFIQQLPLLFAHEAAEPAMMYFRLSGRTFEIPPAFEARASAVSSVNLTILAQAPAFHAPDPPCRDIRDCMWRQVEIYFDPARVRSWLTTQRVDIQEGDYGNGDRAVTRIHCAPPSYNNGLSCEHIFLHDGWVYRFHYGKDDLPQWHAMQDRLVRVVQSFQSAKPD